MLILESISHYLSIPQDRMVFLQEKNNSSMDGICNSHDCFSRYFCSSFGPTNRQKPRAMKVKMIAAAIIKLRGRPSPCEPISVNTMAEGNRPITLAIMNLRGERPLSPATKFITSAGKMGVVKEKMKNGIPWRSARIVHLSTIWAGANFLTRGRP